MTKAAAHVLAESWRSGARDVRRANEDTNRRAHCNPNLPIPIDAASLSHYPTHHVRHEPGLQQSRPQRARAGPYRACNTSFPPMLQRRQLTRAASTRPPDLVLPLSGYPGSAACPGTRIPHQRPANYARHFASGMDLFPHPSSRWYHHPHMAASAHGHALRLGWHGVGRR